MQERCGEMGVGEKMPIKNNTENVDTEALKD